MVSMDIGKWYLATAEFGQKVDALVTELQRSQAVTPQAAAGIARCGVSCAASSNNIFPENNDEDCYVGDAVEGKR